MQALDSFMSTEYLNEDFSKIPRLLSGENSWFTKKSSIQNENELWDRNERLSLAGKVCRNPQSLLMPPTGVALTTTTRFTRCVTLCFTIITSPCFSAAKAASHSVNTSRGRSPNFSGMLSPQSFEQHTCNASQRGGSPNSYLRKNQYAFCFYGS